MKALDKEGLDYLANKVYDAINSGGSADYIVEENTETQTGITWYYRKWASGIAECWGRFISTVTWSKWGNAYQGTPSPSYVTYPTGLFSTNPILSAVCYSTDGNSGTMGVEFFAAASTSRTPNIYAMRPDGGTVPSSFEAAFDISAKGLWKEFTPSTSKATYPLGDYIIMREFTGDTLSMANNTGYNYMIPYTVPDGYKVLGTGTTRSNGNIALGYVGGWSDTQISVWCKHWSGSTLSCTFTVQMFFVKDV